MFVICYKIGHEPVTIQNCKFVSVYVSNVKYCDRAIELGVLDKYPDAAECEDKLLTVTAMLEDGSMATTYDVVCFEGE